MPDPLIIDFTVYGAADTHEQRRLFEKLAEFTGKTVPQLIREKAGLMARYLAENTQPVDGMGGTNPDGGSLKARDLGRGAVRRDLARVYVGGGTAASKIKKLAPNLLKAYWWAMKQGMSAEAERISKLAHVPLAVRDWDHGARHRQLRNNRGRIGKSNDPQVIDDKKSLRAYLKLIEDRVGWAKAGWITAAKKIGTKGLSKVRGWIKNLPAPGAAQDLTNDENRPRIILTNRVKYASRALNQTQFDRTAQQFENAIVAELKAKLKALEDAQNQQNS